MFDTDRGGV